MKIPPVRLIHLVSSHREAMAASCVQNAILGIIALPAEATQSSVSTRSDQNKLTAQDLTGAGVPG